ncbi:MAG: ATP-binding protein [Thermoleophilia bacterium]
MTDEEIPHFRARAQVVTRLGEELITDSTQALLELIKNAYDADARTVRVDVNTTEITEVPKLAEDDDAPATDVERDAGGGDVAVSDGAGAAPHEASNDVDVDVDERDGTRQKVDRLAGWVRIVDSGFGMDRAAIDNGWLTLSASPKRELKDAGGKTTGGRTPLGDKGLGRLGAQRLGDLVRMRTRPTRPPGQVPADPKDTSGHPDVEHRLSFRFSSFTPKIMLEEVPVDWDTLAVGAAADPPWPGRVPWGTVLEVVGLRDPGGWQATGELTNELSKLVNPFTGVERFTIAVRVDGSPIDLQRVGKNLRQSAMTAWEATFDGRQITIHGRLRAEHFRPSKKIERDELERLLLAGESKGLLDALADWRALDSFNPKPGGDGFLVALQRTIDLDKQGAKRDEPDPLWWQSNPCGPFDMQIDTVSLEFKVMRSVGLSVFGGQQQYREYVRERGGVRIYRDGFRVAAGEDILDLGKQFSSGGSFYSLRPANVLGYIAITAEHNSMLEETTDREGLRDTPAAQTFHRVLLTMRDEINRAMDETGRGILAHVRERLRERTGTDRSLEELTADTQLALQRAASVSRAVGDVRHTLTAAADGRELAESNPTLAKGLAAAAAALDETQKDLDQLAGLSPLIDAMTADVTGMREELDQTYQLIGLGLVAEALAHELTHTVRRLTDRSAAIRPVLTQMADRDPELELFVEEVDSIARSLRTQLRHLDPQLRYARERRRAVDVAELVRDTLEYHLERLRDSPIAISATETRAATVRIVPGRLMQVLDNLIFNAEYWVNQEIAKGRLTQGRILITVDGPILTITDNGPGVASEYVTSLFEAFVSAKEQGRGLGLFISRQLLDAEDATIKLRPSQAGAPRDFVIDLSARLA